MNIIAAVEAVVLLWLLLYLNVSSISNQSWSTIFKLLVSQLTLDQFWINSTLSVRVCK